MNAKRSQEDHPAIQDEVTEKGKQLGRPVVNNQSTGKPKRAGEWHPPVMEKSHPDPIIGSRRSRRRPLMSSKTMGQVYCTRRHNSL